MSAEKTSEDLALRLGRDAAKNPVVQAVLAHVRWHGLDVESALCVAVRVLEAELRHEREARASKKPVTCTHDLVETPEGIACGRCGLSCYKGSPLFAAWSAELVRKGLAQAGLAEVQERATYACRHGGFHVGAPCPSDAT